MNQRKIIDTVNKLYAARDATRGFMGDNYPRVMGERMRLLHDIAEARQMDTLACAQEIAAISTAEGQPAVAVVMLAAAVELIEPDNRTPAMAEGTVAHES